MRHYSNKGNVILLIALIISVLVIGVGTLVLIQVQYEEGNINVCLHRETTIICVEDGFGNFKCSDPVVECK